MKPFEDGQLQCRSTVMPNTCKIAYFITPIELVNEQMLQIAHEENCNIAVIYGCDWNNDLTPWPAQAVQRGAKPFAGHAADFIRHLTLETAPVVEKAIGYAKEPERTIAGVSLSGLFALWAWAQSPFFKNACSISGSLWYPGFADWMRSQDLAAKGGKAYISLGKDEASSRNPVFATVGECTDDVATTIRRASNASVLQTLNEGGHHSPIEPRLDAALKWIMKD